MVYNVSIIFYLNESTLSIDTDMDFMNLSEIIEDTIRTYDTFIHPCVEISKGISLSLHSSINEYIISFCLNEYENVNYILSLIKEQGYEYDGYRVS
ncbi:hypothetical protein FACS189472_16320 [Alphaproteobacteria bacterium]|nr:hypothetical protein FACS189472_16320 [Alphaproteobacteria bacterium]